MPGQPGNNHGTGTEPDADLHDRSTTDDAFYEWLLSDHPSARTERDRRRQASYQYEADSATAVRAWADKINAATDAPQPLRDLAASMRPRTDESAMRAEISHA